MPNFEIMQVAESTPLNNTGTDFEAENVRDGLIELDLRQITKEPTGFVDRSQSQLSFTDATRTFSIAVKSPATEFVYYIRGKRYSFSTTQTVVINDTYGLWYIYFNGSTLTASQTAWEFDDEYAFVAYVLWDATNNKHLLLGEERHGLSMDWATHQRLHRINGPAIEPGGCLVGDYVLRGDGSLNSHVQFSVGDGYLHDEDIIMNIKHAATPTNDFEQVLSTIAYLPIYYKSGVGGDWTKINSSAIPVAYNATGLQYNYYNSGTNTWSLENVTDGWFTTYWVIITNDISEPVKVVVGQTQEADAFSSSTDISVETLLDEIWGTEVVALEKVIYQYSSSYTNTPKAIMYDVVDIANVSFDFDRYNFTASYGGNAGTGRYLEVFPSVSSLEAPFSFPENSFIRTVTYHTAANSTGTIGFFDENDLVNPVFSISITNSSEAKFDLTEYFPAATDLVIRVTSGSFSKPNLRIFVQTEIT